MKASFALLLVAAAGCLASSAMAAGEGADSTSATPVTVCGNVVGAKWVFPKTGGKFTGNKYGVTAVGVSCAIAKKYAVKLSGTKLAGKTAGHSYPLAGGPKGYTCYANPDANGKLLAASCQIGPLTAVSKHVFSWGGRP
jgi:hypothetical protein